ncbi:MAG: adenosylcobinamide-phosphate synthase CbiB [Chloroflexi bacterium]|nr:adenosylcobinamide-phosphate synthase CbiB [Chloroflexota bacterium]
MEVLLPAMMFALMFSEWWNYLALDAAVFLVAVILDRVSPELPAVIHPVVWIGRAIDLLARAAPQRPGPAFIYGCGIVVVVVGASGALAWLVMAGLMSLGPLAYVIGGAVLLRTTFTVRGLSSAAQDTRRALAEDRLGEARESLKSLVGRDRSSLTAPLVAAAAIESVAENSTDSYVGPWLAFAIFGVPGAAAYRAVNTLDSMLGHHGRYEYLGKAAAHLDDVVNLLPARLSALLLVSSGALTRFPIQGAWRVMLRDRRCTASPNAGWTMAAMAGLLGTRLEKQGHYRLGDGLREPEAADIGRAVRLAEGVAVLGVLVALALLAARHGITA